MPRRLLPLLATLLLVLAACGGSGSTTSDAGNGGSPSTGVVDKGESLVPTVPSGSGDGSAMVVTSSLGLAVDEVDAAIATARATVTGLGGTLVGMSRGSDGGYPLYRNDGSIAGVADAPAYLTFRLPADRLEAAVDALRGLGDLVSERTDASDVSASLRDLGARLKNLRAAEANYQRLLDQAADVGDLLAVTAQLDAVRGQIEQLAAEQAALDDAVARSTISLVLYPPATPIADAAEDFDLGAIVEQAAGTLIAAGIAIATGLVYLVVLGGPLALLLLVLYLLVGRRIAARLRTGRKRR